MSTTQQLKTIDVAALLGVKLYCDDVPTTTLKDTPITMECEFFPNAQSGLHIHPHQDEEFQILSGALDVWLNGQWQQLSTGQKITIPKGSPHEFRNTSGEVVRLINTHTPGLRFREYMEGIERLIRENKITGMGGFKNTLYLSRYVVEYNDVLILVKPPYPLVKLAARLASLLGYSVQ
jgi:mannose-6-phosphate isomerase-like protein (cupin superfamily)